MLINLLLAPDKMEKNEKITLFLWSEAVIIVEG
jgi:hypothetical protein